jgi:hypothetical protein
MFNFVKERSRRKMKCDAIYEQHHDTTQSIQCPCGGYYKVKHYKVHCETIKHNHYLSHNIPQYQIGNQY